MPTNTKLIIDADPGVGDALAIALALLDRNVDVVGLTAVDSFLPARQSLFNLQELVALIDPPRWPRLGATDPDDGGNHPRTDTGVALKRRLNGETGLGDWPSRGADPANPRDASKLLIDLTKNDPEEIVLLTLGPLTNVCRAAEKDADFLMRLKGIVCLGGTVTAPGDVAARAEFNMVHDPESAQLVLTSPCTKLMVPRDITQQVGLSFDHISRMPLDVLGHAGEFLRSLISYAVRASHQFLGTESCPLPEVTAFAAAVRPDLFQFDGMAVDVETEGTLTRGMTVFDLREPPEWRPNVDVVTGVESQGVVDYVQSVLKNAKTRS